MLVVDLEDERALPVDADRIARDHPALEGADQYHGPEALAHERAAVGERDRNRHQPGLRTRGGAQTLDIGLDRYPPGHLRFEIDRLPDFQPVDLPGLDSDLE